MDSSDVSDCLRRGMNVTQSSELVPDELHRELAREAFDAYGREMNAAAAMAQDLSPILAAASCANVYVSVHAAELLNLLAVDRLEARDSVRELLRTGNQNARIAAVAAVDHPRKLPEEFVEEVLRVGLSDVLINVQTHAANTVWQLGVKSLLPDLIRMRDALTDADAQGWVDLYIDLTRDGYFLERYSPEVLGPLQNADGTPCRDVMWTIKVRCEHQGGVSLVGCLVRDAKIQSQGAAAVARAVCEEWLGQYSRRPDAKTTSSGGWA